MGRVLNRKIFKLLLSFLVINSFAHISKPWLYVEGKYIKNWEGKPFILGAIGTIWQSELYAPENTPTIPIVRIEINKPRNRSLKSGESWKSELFKLVDDAPVTKIQNFKGASKGKIVKLKSEAEQYSFFTVPLPFHLVPGKYEISLRYYSPKEGCASTGVYIQDIPEDISLTYALPEHKDDRFHIYTRNFYVSHEVNKIVFKKTDSSNKEGLPLDWIQIKALFSQESPQIKIRTETNETMLLQNASLEIVKKGEIKALSLKSEADLYSFFSFPLQSPLKPGEYELIVDYIGDPQRTGALTIYINDNGIHRELVGLPHKLDGKIHTLKINFCVGILCEEIVFKKTGGIPYERRIWNDDFSSLLIFFKKHGLNAVRIAVSAYFDELGDKKLKELGGFEGFIKKTIDPLVQTCKKNEMYAIIDLHTYPQSKDILYNWFIPFWKEIARIYKDEGWVAAYELWNEPVGIGAEDLRKWYRDCIREIRRIDPRRIIIISDASAGWRGAELTWSEVNFDTGDPERQVIFTLHGGVGPSGLKDVDFLCHITDKWNVPIMLGEWECDDEWDTTKEERERGKQIFQKILDRLKACRSTHAHSFMIWRAHKPPAYIEFWGPFAKEYCGIVNEESQEPQQLLLIAEEKTDFIPILKELHIPFEHFTSLSALDNLSNYSSLILSSLNYPEPNILSEELMGKIKSFVENGGRAFIEYSLSPNKELFGIQFTSPRRMLHERLIVSSEHYLTRELERDTLLEEHNSAFIQPLNTRGDIILHYGKVLGTYKLFQPQYWVEVNMDFGQVYTLSLLRQRYGASIFDYCPEKVEVYLSKDGKLFQLAGNAEGDLLPQMVEIDLQGWEARYLKIKLYKYKRSPTTDWLFLGEIEVMDEKGENIALHKPYSLSPPPSSLYPDGYPPKLTDGLIEGHYSDKLSIGWTTPSPPSPLQPALLVFPMGKGEIILSCLKISDFKSRFFRPSEKWETLLRNIALYVLPTEERRRAETSYIPLKTWTEPQKWVNPGEKISLFVQTRPGVSLEAKLDGKEIFLTEIENGKWCGSFQLMEEGMHQITIMGRYEGLTNTKKLEIEVKERKRKYREVLDRNIDWFLRSGVMPKVDGSEGVYNQRCIAWFDGGPLESLPSPYRIDCNAKSALAFYLYGKLTGDDRFKKIAENIIDFMLPHQLTDPKRPSYGGWTWLHEGIDTIYFWDDNTRTTMCLLYLYKETGNEKYLLPALRTLELCRGVAHADGLITRTAVEPEELDEIGRSAYKQFQQGIAPDFDLLRWFSGYGITGDEKYKNLGEICLRCWKHFSTVRGLPIAYYYTKDQGIKKIIIDYWRSYLEIPDVKKWGVFRVNAPDYALAFEGDCSITTHLDDPLSDQLYQTSFQLLHAWWSFIATGDPVCLEAFHKIGDFLARIQMESNDERINGAWVRGWDLENWECFGAPYDPNYGPYSAYTGWMNSIIDIAYSLYLLNENPFPPIVNDEIARALLEKVRKETPKDKIGEENIALGCHYDLTPLPEGKYTDTPPGKLTDGLIDGHYEDGLSVGWHIPQGGSLEVKMKLDLGQQREIAMVAQRYGAGVPGYIPNEVVVIAGENETDLKEIVRCKPQQAGFLYVPLPQPINARFIEFVVKKVCFSPTQDFLFIGETLVFPFIE